MKNIIDFILESKGQRISQRTDNRPYDPKDDKLLKKKDSRPERAQKLRETRLDKQVQEFCSALVNDFMVKFYNLTINKSTLLSFEDLLTRVFNTLAEDNKLNDIKPKTDRSAGGCVFLHTSSNDSKTAHTDHVLRYETSDTFANILKNLNFYYKIYYINWERCREDISRDGSTKLNITGNSKFVASVLHKLRKHDLAKKAEKSISPYVNLFDIFDDVADNYNKNYFADKFKEFESAYNDVLAKW